MTRFEEEVVERWYVIRGYLTARNISYPSPVRIPGGKGRGEIDLLAIKVENGEIIDRVRVEVSVSVTSSFPFTSDRVGVDEVGRLIKKFFSKGALIEAQKYLGSPNYRNQLVCSKLAGNVKEKLVKRLPKFNSRLLNFEEIELGKRVKILHEPAENPEIWISGELEIEIIPFESILRDLHRIFRKRGLLRRNFEDPVMRAIQHLIRIVKV